MKILKGITVVFAVILGSVSGLIQAFEFEDVTPEEAGFSSEKLSKIEERFDALYEDGRIPNYAIGLYTGDKRFYSKARGRTSIGAGELVNLDTIFPFASMTKPIASTAIMMLIQEGKLTLDTKLSEFYPEYANMFVAPGGSFETTFEEAKREITVKDLLTHTSGFTYPPSVTGQGDVAKQYADLRLFFDPEPTLDQHIATLSQVPLVAHPGETFTYSVSIDVLAGILEKLTGQRLGDFLEKRIFEPLGMKDSGFFVPPGKVERFAQFYMPMQATASAREALDQKYNAPSAQGKADDKIDWKISEGSMFGSRVRTVKPTFDAAGAGLYASLNDYARYCAMILNGGIVGDTRILKSETLELHLSDLTPQLTSENFRRDFGDGATFMKFGGGHGIKYQSDPAPGVGVDYYFWGGAFNTFYWIDPDNGHLGVFATNHSPPQYNISDDIEQIVDEAKL